MSLALWRSPLSRALHRNRSNPESRYVQLATVRPNGLPANRTVVFRGFLEGANQLVFVTDQRSHKVTDLHHQPWGEICWYFSKTREQFRLLGVLALVAEETSAADLQAIRRSQWEALSDKARRQFTWPHPGDPRTEQETFERADPSSVEPVPCFSVLMLNPENVDHLELRGNPQNRTRYFLDQAHRWHQQSINP